MIKSRKSNAAKEVKTTLKARKVLYDDDTGGVCIETIVETLQRQSWVRFAKTQVLNKGQMVKLLYLHHEIEASRKFFNDRNLSIVNGYKQTLRERIALKHILAEYAEIINSDTDFRRYGFGISKAELNELIQRRIAEDSPSYRRRKAAKKLLQQRKPSVVFDRTMTTSAILLAAREKRLGIEPFPKIVIEDKKLDDDKGMFPPISLLNC